MLRNCLRKHKNDSAENLYDLLVVEGKIAELAPAGALTPPREAAVYDAGGRQLFPSFIDAHVHLRDPGFEYKEDMQSGLCAAVHGGFGAVMAMANTNPVNDKGAVTGFIREKAARICPRGPRVYPVGALSVGLMGEELAPMGELAEAGAVAISNDGRPVQNNELFRRAVEYAASFGLKVIDHCEDADIAHNWQINEGGGSLHTGLKGQPSVGEAVQVARDILFAEYLNLPIHLAHISCRQSTDLIRWAKVRGVPVTAETCPHYLLLDDAKLHSYNTNFKVSPPLRTSADVAALVQAVQDGTIDILVTDHAPHAAYEKDTPFDESPRGFIGLETAVPLTSALFSAELLEELWCKKPAEIFKLPRNNFAPGDPADFFLFDLETPWVVNRDNIHSKSLNSPWLGQTMQGKIVAHWLGGTQIFSCEDSLCLPKPL
ncbi:MAG: dihydroorotase [Deltaproteobacteria bacterium]|nr:dihydroorotase [Deltaproteobacteria bacterium]